MNINPVIDNKFKEENNNMITTAQVLSLGFSKTLLANYVKEGLLERIVRTHSVYPFGKYSKQRGTSKKDARELWLLLCKARTSFDGAYTKRNDIRKFREML